MNSLDFIRNASAPITNAFVFAMRSHDKQLRRGREPYVNHSIRVAMMLKDWGCHEEVVIAGILHDVLEDTAVTEEELRTRFTARTVDLVVKMTKAAGESSSTYCDRMLDSGDREWWLIKLADTNDNSTMYPHDGLVQGWEDWADRMQVYTLMKIAIVKKLSE